MITNHYKVIGLMSGTSLDGIDLVYATFQFKERWTFDILKSETVPYDENWEQTLKHLTNFSADGLSHIDDDYSLYLAGIISDFIKKHQIEDIDFVASHGHTALHQPEKGLTYQIGNRQILSDKLNLKVICDFRVQDMEYGGQGAPLVPIGDRHLFSDYDYCLNLGGFANVSYEDNGERLAFDICPVNIVMNKLVSEIGLDFDDNGQLASSGKVNTELLDDLNTISFYSENPPKSLGLEWVDETIFPILLNYKLPLKDTLRTWVEHVGFQIGNVLNQENSKCLVTGGGVFNSFLMSRIEAYSTSELIIPDKKIIEFKEALIFAFLGVLRDRNEVNCLSSVTGAEMDHSSGKIFIPTN
ncbi:anhydro-N-acetylmuramic acid kinase [Winogradskyella maritima]|uniref:Anhydro-N-acetylmuramic acid kinase n=1 Tax=Winogradskyella maritima TaxID=1517766 RepID=A0ABV8AKI1_9FLAO|nr:anhydro-N-acetylmuramic acid kinase [Winogradskyella maritima]